MADNNTKDDKRDEKTKIQWLHMWESELGKMALQDFNELQQGLLQQALAVVDPNQMNYFLGRAGGVGYVIDYILATCNEARELEKELKTDKTKH